ncbi:MAG: acyl-CoA thioesterase [Sneathiella sp.]
MTESKNQMNFRTVKSSQTVLKELMVPSYANFGGKVHGGVILSLMDKISYTCAASHAKGYCVTASVDSVDFINAVDVGDLLTLYASINYVGRSSLEVGIKVVSENFKEGILRHTNTSYFTMVALDELTRKPVSVPGLILENEVEIRRFIEGKLRREFKRTHQQGRLQARDRLDLNVELKELRRDNCLLRSIPHKE